MGEAEEVTSGGRGLLSVDDELGEIADVASANRKLLSDTLDEIAGMSHGANGRRLLITLPDATFCRPSSRASPARSPRRTASFSRRRSSPTS